MTCAARFRTILLALTLSFGGGHAFAQLGLGPGGGVGGGHGGTRPESDSDEPKKQAPPPAIPGAVASPDSVVPAAKGAKDLDPNAALFDAIDRGDLTAARDALNRGADLNARNVLGQRPLDMSIDLSRNPITFLLLSERSQEGAENAASAGESAVGDEDQQATTMPVKTGRHGRTRPASRTLEVAASATRPATIDAPQPSAGFLGFGSR